MTRIKRWYGLLGCGVLAALAGLMAQGAGAQEAPPAPAAKPFFARWGDFYRGDWAPPAVQAASAQDAAAAPTRRGLPSPLDSPPFPNSDWSYGGSPVIGEPDGQSYPLMSAINGAKSRVKVYGWVEPTVNGSTSAHDNFPVANDETANRLELNQFVLYVERLPDTVQQKHFDWGFHLTSLVGTDYRFTTGKGYFSGQLLNKNNSYGFDPSLEYVDLYFPKVAKGMNVRVGRYISIPGIEAQLAPNNYTFSHSLLYSIDPFTDTGVLATVKLTDQWLVQGGLSAGHDVAPWTSDAKPSGTACVSYTTKSVNDNVYVCANGINSGKYAYNNLQQYDATWYHKFSKRLHSATESYFMYERDVPSVAGPVVPETGANGAFCRAGVNRCTAPEWAAVNFLQYEANAHNFFSLRTDFLNDKKGQRTAYQTRYSEETVSWTHWWGTTVQLRPEMRFDRAWDRAAYGKGTHQNQFTVASDLIFHF
ncbi:outer membrane beta-barrel protein [Granulicella tundricola]|nr:outer membrane beta-barrel protein [Granulicella tundricola]